MVSQFSRLELQAVYCKEHAPKSERTYMECTAFIELIAGLMEKILRSSA